MKFIGRLCLLVLVSVLFAGCGSNNGGTAKSTAPQSQTTQPSASAQSQPTVAEQAQPTDAHAHVTSQAGAGQAKEIKLTATNFEFDQKEVRIKKGDKIKLTLENKEGAHGLAIPDFKVDLKQPGIVEFIADKTGTFTMQCSVVCGVGHTKMMSKLIVE